MVLALVRQPHTALSRPTCATRKVTRSEPDHDVGRKLGKCSIGTMLGLVLASAGSRPCRELLQQRSVDLPCKQLIVRDVPGQNGRAFDSKFEGRLACMPALRPFAKLLNRPRHERSRAQPTAAQAGPVKAGGSTIVRNMCSCRNNFGACLVRPPASKNRIAPGHGTCAPAGPDWNDCEQEWSIILLNVDQVHVALILGAEYARSWELYVQFERPCSPLGRPTPKKVAT